MLEIPWSQAFLQGGVLPSLCPGQPEKKKTRYKGTVPSELSSPRAKARVKSLRLVAPSDNPVLRMSPGVSQSSRPQTPELQLLFSSSPKGKVGRGLCNASRVSLSPSHPFTITRGRPFITLLPDQAAPEEHGSTSLMVPIILPWLPSAPSQV